MRFSRTAAIVGAVITAAGCHQMATLSFDEVASLRPARVYVTQADNGSVMEVSGPQVYNDTLVGYVNGQFTELPASDLKKMVVKRPARAKTIALFAAGTATAAVIGYWISGLGKPSERDLVDCDYDETNDPRCN